MSYKPIHPYRKRDKLPPNDPNKIIYGSHLSDDFEAISNALYSVEQKIAGIESGSGTNPSPDPDGPSADSNDPRISDEQIGNWDESHEWGNHSTAGYLTAEEDPTVPGHVKAITEADIQKWDAGTGGDGYDDAEIRADLAKEVEDRKSGDQLLQDQLDAISDIAPVTVSEDEPEGSVGQLWYKPSEGAMYVHDGNGWQAFGSGGDGGDGGDGGGSTGNVLIIAGGGGGGGSIAGGGGGGGFREILDVEFIAGQGYPVVVGAGGDAGARDRRGASGGNSSVASHISYGGGGGGSYSTETRGQYGGSGGGTSNDDKGGAGNAGADIPEEGYDGGRGLQPNSPAGGGGGAGGVGADATADSGGNGGPGRQTTILPVQETLAGGGGGGALGGTQFGSATDGGGNGGSSGQPENGSANTGGGGGGGGYQGDDMFGGKGGSGIVIINASEEASLVQGDPVLSEVGGRFIYRFEGTGSITF
jgi:hypothetical protein